MAKLSEQELAELAGCSLDHIRRLVDLGILVPRDGDQPFQPSDAHLVGLMAAFDRAGISLNDVARGIASGELSFRLDLFLSEPDAASGTYEALAADLGRSPELLRQLSSELGLPPPADDRIRSDDAEMLSRIVTALDVVDDAELLRFVRLYGGTVRRLVESAVQFFDRAVHRRIVDRGLPSEEQDRLVDEKGASMIDLANRLVPWLQRRLREHALLDYTVATTETYMDERGIAPRREAQLRVDDLDSSRWYSPHNHPGGGVDSQGLAQHDGAPWPRKPSRHLCSKSWFEVGLDAKESRSDLTTSPRSAAVNPPPPREGPGHRGEGARSTRNGDCTVAARPLRMAAAYGARVGAAASSRL